MNGSRATAGPEMVVFECASGGGGNTSVVMSGMWQVVKGRSALR